MTDTATNLAPATTASEAPAADLAIPDDTGSLVNSHDEWAELPDTFAELDDGLPAPLMRPDRRGAGGFWIDDLTGEKHEALEVVLLTGRRTRAWWEADYDGSSNPPDCRSFDGLVPDPQSPNLQNTACATCPHSVFIGGKASECRERYDVLAYDPEVQTVFMTAFSGAAIKPFRRYLSSFKAKIPKRPPYSVVTRIELEKTEGDMGVFFTPKFSRVRDLTPADVAPLLASQQEAIDQWLSWVDRSVITGETVGADPEAATDAEFEPFPDDNEPAEGEVVDGEVEDPDDMADLSSLEAVGDRAGLNRSGVLQRARKYAIANKLEPPTSFDAISHAVAAGVHAELQTELGEEPF